ncbi:MAG: hypothetical protein IT445_04935 [Phycisphaeraceae bacterium]|nr:hypothetical protein [Phycisphaeraceae bacterium]
MNIHDQDSLDRATAARLAKLAGRPVDASAFKRKLERVMREQTESDAAPSRSLRPARWWRPITSIAAVLLLALSVAWLMLEGGTPAAEAAPTELARIYQEVTSGRTPHLEVTSVEEANRLLSDQAQGIVPIPELPGQLQSCCLHQHAGATLTCAVIERDGQRIAVVMADGAKLHSPKGQQIERDGRQFIFHTTNGINMVMAHEGGRWLCVMGDASAEILVEVAADIRM